MASSSKFLKTLICFHKPYDFFWKGKCSQSQGRQRSSLTTTFSQSNPTFFVVCQLGAVHQCNKVFPQSKTNICYCAPIGVLCIECNGLFSNQNPTFFVVCWLDRSIITQHTWPQQKWSLTKNCLGELLIMIRLSLICIWNF